MVRSWLLLGTLLATAAQAATRERVAVLPLEVTRGVESSVARALEPLLLAELAPMGEVLGESDLKAMLRFERTKQLLGCEGDSSCLAELAGALGAAKLVSGSLGLVGETYVVNLSLIDAVNARVVRRATETATGGVDRLYDALRRAARKLAEREPPPVAFDPKAFAKVHLTPAECLAAARLLLEQDAGKGWAGLRACIDRGRFPRDDFTDLRSLLADPWLALVTKQPDAPKVLAQLVALRGGDVEGDLRRLRDARVAVFTLEQALGQAASMKGRTLVVRARIVSLGEEKGRPVARLEETSLRTVGSSWDRGTDNVKLATGRYAYGRLVASDPFLELRRDYVFALRFEGTREQEFGPAAGEASVLGWWVPAASLRD